MDMGSCDAEFNFGTLNDILCRRSHEYFNADFSSIAFEEEGLKDESEACQNMPKRKKLPVCLQAFSAYHNLGSRRFASFLRFPQKFFFEAGPLRLQMPS